MGWSNIGSATCNKLALTPLVVGRTAGGFVVVQNLAMGATQVQYWGTVYLELVDSTAGLTNITVQPVNCYRRGVTLNFSAVAFPLSYTIKVWIPKHAPFSAQTCQIFLNT